MKVLLINPPSMNEISSNTPSIVDEEQGFFPPLGIMYVAAYAEKYTDHEITILDTQAEQLEYDQIEDEIRKRKPDVVGITAMTFSLIDSMLAVNAVKRVNKNTIVVMGGPHVSIFPEETINLPGIDYLLMGEGEFAFVELLQNLDDKNKLKNIKGLVFKENGNIVNTGSPDFIKDLNTLPYPARHLTPHKKYRSILSKESYITTMVTSRGCPFSCTYCNRPHMGKVFRNRTADNILDEMAECLKMGIREISIYDDTFTVNRKRVLDICEGILDRGLKIRWDIRTRVDVIDKELLIKLGEAGCDRIHYGIEAGTADILKVLKKGTNLEQIQEAITWTKEAGISTLAYFMIGSPGETREQIMQTINLARKLEPDFAHFSITTPFPATELYESGLQQGIIKEDYWREFSKNPSIDFEAPYWAEKLSREELVELINLAYKSFYVRPKYILKSAIRVRSFEEFRRKAKAGLKVFRM
ncbi:B12-binding domain-containing radical SAM protein [Chloroflexota bacterium]